MSQRVTGNAGNRVALLALALMLFCFLTSEVFAAGAMTPMSQDLGVPAATIGSFVTVYAVVAAISILPMTALSRRVSVRTLLAGAVVVLTTGHLVMAASSSVWVIVLARAATALFHGPVWALAPLIATRLVPQRPSAATATVFLGPSVASVAGAPAVGLGDHRRPGCCLRSGSPEVPSS